MFLYSLHKNSPLVAEGQQCWRVFEQSLPATVQICRYFIKWLEDGELGKRSYPNRPLKQRRQTERDNIKKAEKNKQAKREKPEAEL